MGDLVSPDGKPLVNRNDPLALLARYMENVKRKNAPTNSDIAIMAILSLIGNLTRAHATHTHNEDGAVKLPPEVVAAMQQAEMRAAQEPQEAAHDDE